MGAANLSDLKLMVDPGDEEVNIGLQGGEALSLLVEAGGQGLVGGGVGVDDGGEVGLQEAVDEVLGEERAVRQGLGDPLQGEEDSRKRVDSSDDGGVVLRTRHALVVLGDQLLGLQDVWKTMNRRLVLGTKLTRATRFKLY